MKLCRECKNRGKKSRCKYYTEISNYAEECKDFEEKKQTNADRIRSMSDEELAKLITSGEMCAICPFCQYYGTKDCYMENEGEHMNCAQGIMKWLQSEAEE